MNSVNMRSAGIVMLLSVLFVLSARANNIKVDNVRTRGLDALAKEVYIEFDLSWENAWRNAVNHDAAWVFAKFRAPGSNEWQHAYLVAAAGAHWAHNAVIAVGTNDNAGVGSGRGMGVFVYANADQAQGPADYPGTRLRWDFGASGYVFTAGDAVDVSVHAIEMVYVAEGAFYVGSGGTESGSFTDGSWIIGATIPYRIASEDALDIGPDSGKLWGTSSGGVNTIGSAGPLSAAFPKGYGAFYCMKYSITQGQYADFLNMLTYAEQDSRINGSPDDAEGSYSHASDRHRIHIATSGASPNTPAVYATDYPWVACNYLSWADGASYVAWAGLRPMTELEYEKACRGPEAPIPNEYAWGTATISSTGGSGNYSDLGEATESVSHGNAIYSGSSPGGPARVGIFATAESTREQAGASYWGIMELSGNVWERPISVGHASIGRNFAGTHGGGTLTLPDDWPGTGAGAGFRGGDWYYTGPGGGGWYVSNVDARVSDRNHAGNANATRYSTHGWRGVRSGPQ